MGDKDWKQLERDAGILIGGKRYPANQGGLVDVESPRYVVQVKHRRSLSLAKITKLVEQMHMVGRSKGKHGLVVAKLKKGRGKPSPMLVIQLANEWKVLNDAFILNW